MLSCLFVFCHNSDSSKKTTVCTNDTHVIRLEKGTISLPPPPSSSLVAFPSLPFPACQTHLAQVLHTLPEAWLGVSLVLRQQGVQVFLRTDLSLHETSVTVPSTERDARHKTGQHSAQAGPG